MKGHEMRQKNSNNMTTLLYVAVLSISLATFFGARQIHADENHTSTKAISGCTIKKELGSFTVAGVSCDVFWENSYPSKHPCASADDRPDVCASLDAYRAVDWDAPVDLINTSHRGLWGMDLLHDSMENTEFDYRTAKYNTYVPENSGLAAHQAREHGIQGAEFDASLLNNSFGESSGVGSDHTAVFTHYVDFYHYTFYEGAYDTTISGRDTVGLVNNTSPARLKATHPELFLKDKFGRTIPPSQYISNETVTLNNADTFLKIFGSRFNELILFVDSKNSRELKKRYIDADGNLASRAIANFGVSKHAVAEKTAVVKSILKAAQNLPSKQAITSAMASLVFKSGSRFNADTLMNAIKQSDTAIGQPLVVPNLNLTTSMSDELDRLDEFYLTFGREGILYYEITYPSKKHWSANGFSRGGKAYLDLSDYIKRHYNLRSGFWFPSATTTVGGHTFWKQTGNFYAQLPDWEKQGTNLNNQIGSMVNEPIYLIGNAMWMTHAVTVNEHPEVYLQIRNALIGALK